VALAAREAGAPCAVMIMDTTPETKRRAVGARRRLHGATYDECWKTVIGRTSDRMRHLVHPFDDDEFIAGNGTAGLEIVEDLPTWTRRRAARREVAVGVSAAVRKLLPATKILQPSRRPPRR
jgi:threonine dehydratase